MFRKFFAFCWKYSLPGMLKCDKKSYYVGVLGGIVTILYAQNELKKLAEKELLGFRIIERN